jgi:hypothetical protein
MCLSLAIPLLDCVSIIACGLLIRRFVRHHYVGPNEAERRKLNHHLNLNLFIQAIFYKLFIKTRLRLPLPNWPNPISPKVY